MGYWKEIALEMQESADDRRLADILGITYGELTGLDYEIETDESSDGMVYNYRVEFSEASPKRILKKIKRLEDKCRVYLQPWELDEEFDYDEQFEAITKTRNIIKSLLMK